MDHDAAGPRDADTDRPVGVPLEWVNGNDFTAVSAALSKDLGGEFIAAGVAGRIKFVGNLSRPDADGLLWVDTPAQEIADSMGVTVKQVRRALSILEERGYITRKPRNLGPWDRGMSVALVIRKAHVP